MDEKITIIEGPPPTFDAVHELWVTGIHETPTLGKVVVTQLRTFNGAELVERCHRAWRHREPIQLEYKSPEGLKLEAPIVAARNSQTDSGDLLTLWVRLPEDDIQVEFSYLDDVEDFDEDGESDLEDFDDYDLPDVP